MYFGRFLRQGKIRRFSDYKEKYVSVGYSRKKRQSMEKYVDILLSTYNGEKYIDQLVKSVLKQSYPYIRLLIRDDRSSDATVDRILEWKRHFPEKIEYVQDNKGNLGVTRSMFALLQNSTSDYVMFCDQDDVWFKDKVKNLVRFMESKEQHYPEDPILVHCEAYTTDERLNPVNRDKKKNLTAYQSGKNKNQTSFANLLLSNPVQGASMLFNRKLVQELSVLFDKKIGKTLIYDSIVSSVCSICGRIFLYNHPLMYYRQHGRNVVGAKKRYLYKMGSYSEKEANELKTAHYLLVNRTKCQLLKKYYKNKMTDKQKEILEHYMHTPNNWFVFFKLRLYREFSLKQILIMMIYRIA